MKNISISKRVSTIKHPPITSTGNLESSFKLSPQLIIEAVNQASFELPSDILDKIELLKRTVILNSNHLIEQTENGPVYLEFLPPVSINVLDNYVSILTEPIGKFPISPFVNFGGTLWLMLPKGFRYAIDFYVKSAKKNTFFHYASRYKDFSNEFVKESSGNAEHISFNVDTSESVFYGIDMVNMNAKRQRAWRFKEWEFYRCTIVRLD